MARSANKSITDMELATYIADLIGSDHHLLPEDEFLSLLEYDNFSTSAEYIKVNENNEFVEVSKREAYGATRAIDKSEDGYMELNTNFVKRKTSGQYKYFDVSVGAQWIKYPKVALTDVLVLGTNGTFDDSYDEAGLVRQVFKCNLGCTKNTTRNRDVDRHNRTDGDLCLKYANYVPYISFTPLTPTCDYCSGRSSDDKYFNAAIRYGVITTTTCNIQASYGHKTFGLSNVSVGLSATGVPKISVGFGSTITVYNARAVTLK